MSNIDFTELPYDSDLWELFARDFLEQLGFSIDSPPSRGADGGKDILISECVQGGLHRSTFKWLVSCKHFAKSGRSVSEVKDENNIIERMRSFNADGFMGFYSTLASSGLTTRLDQLRHSMQIKDYKIFDGELISKYLLTVTHSDLFTRFFPESYKKWKVPHLIVDEYLPIQCDVCGTDLLNEFIFNGIDSRIGLCNSLSDGKHYYHDVYYACTGACDRQLEKELFKKFSAISSWNSLEDLAIPQNYIRFMLCFMNLLESGQASFSKKAYDKLKTYIIALGQIVVRETSQKDKERFIDLLKFPF